MIIFHHIPDKLRRKQCGQFCIYLFFLPHDTMSLCCRPVSVCLSVCMYVMFVHSIVKLLCRLR